MINSCEKCTTPCCRTGPGPYRNVSPEEYLENFSTSEAYNTKCIGLTDDGKCNLWLTPDLPIECRNYICQTRSYSAEELKKIDEVQDDRTCPNCKCNWMLGFWEGSFYYDTCEVCGYTIKWQRILERRGRRNWSKRK